MSDKGAAKFRLFVRSPRFPEDRSKCGTVLFFEIDASTHVESVELWLTWRPTCFVGRFDLKVVFGRCLRDSEAIMHTQHMKQRQLKGPDLQIEHEECPMSVDHRN